jgi:hypothetical protein
MTRHITLLRVTYLLSHSHALSFSLILSLFSLFSLSNFSLIFFLIVADAAEAALRLSADERGAAAASAARARNGATMANAAATKATDETRRLTVRVTEMEKKAVAHDAVVTALKARCADADERVAVAAAQQRTHVAAIERLEAELTAADDRRRRRTAAAAASAVAGG